MRVARDQTQVWPANSVLQYRYGRLCSQVSEFFELKGMFLRILQSAARQKCPVEEHSFQLYEFTAYWCILLANLPCSGFSDPESYRLEF